MPVWRNCSKITATFFGCAASPNGRKNTAIPGALRELNRQPDANYTTFQKGIEHSDPAIAANVMIGLIKVTSYLLHQQLRRLEQDFLKEGGLRERMTRARLAVRSRQGPPT